MRATMEAAHSSHGKDPDIRLRKLAAATEHGLDPLSACHDRNPDIGISIEVLIPGDVGE